MLLFHCRAAVCSSRVNWHVSSPLRAKLLESEAVNENLRKSLSRASTRSSLYGGGPGGAFSQTHLVPEREASDVIEMAKKSLEKLKKKERKKKKRYSVAHMFPAAMAV